MSTILVTGGSGFIAAHTIARLLGENHRVRTTLRNLGREAEVRTMLKEAHATPSDQLSFFAADLEDDAGWVGAVEGCDYVLHIASPLPPNVLNAAGYLCCRGGYIRWSVQLRDLRRPDRKRTTERPQPPLGGLGESRPRIRRNGSSSVPEVSGFAPA
jgi:NAD(P)-dependent dehydrogenase (short-subunit alcohol dehydrogenase family)